MKITGLKENQDFSMSYLAHYLLLTELFIHFNHGLLLPPYTWTAVQPTD